MTEQTTETTETTETLDQFIKRLNITCTAHEDADNPNMADVKWKAQATHFKVNMIIPGEHGRKRSMVMYFSAGRLIADQYRDNKGKLLRSVLDSLASDASGIENVQTFEEWAGDYGYDTDSRSAEATYEICRDQAKELKAFLGESDYDTLLWHIERD